MSAYSSVTSHRAMALDRVRNHWYEAALRRVITSSSVVLDVGAGIGIHGLMAARLGARRVFLVEPEDIIAVAEENVRANHVEGIVQCIHGRIEDVVLPEPVDVIVSALTGNFLLAEDLLPILFHARDAALKSGGTMIPDRAMMHIVPVAAPILHEREIAAWGEMQHGVSLAAARAYAANTIHYRWDRNEVAYIAEPQAVRRIDLSTDTYDDLHVDVEFAIAQAGLCHGFAGWFSMRLGEHWVSTEPTAEAMHWSPTFLPLDPPVHFSVDDRIRLWLDRPAFGEWSWRGAWRGGAQVHSTMLGVPLKASTLGKASPDFLPVLAADGELTSFVLSRCDGSTSVAEIVAQVRDRWPGRYASDDQGLKIVQSIVKRFARAGE